LITNAIKSSRGFEDDRILVMQSNHKEKSSNFKKFNESRMKIKIVSKSPKCSNNVSNSDENYLDSNAEFHSRDTKEDNRLILSIGTNSHPSLKLKTLTTNQPIKSGLD